MTLALKTGTLALAAALTAAALPAQALDSGLTKQLADAGLKYDVTKAGNAKVLFNETDGRSQEVYIRGTTDPLDGLVLREIWSVAGTLEAEPEAQTLLDLLSEGGSQTIGAWNLEKSDDGWLVYYGAKLPAALAGTDLRSALEAIAAVADDKEKELFDSDEN
jgi:hypothetical protein